MSSETHVGGITSSLSPCEAAAKASMDCLEKNDYKRSQCLHIFEAYKECKKTWVRPSFCGPWSRPDPLHSSLPRGGPTGEQAKTPLSYK